MSFPSHLVIETCRLQPPSLLPPFLPPSTASPPSTPLKFSHSPLLYFSLFLSSHPSTLLSVSHLPYPVFLPPTSNLLFLLLFIFLLAPLPSVSLAFTPCPTFPTLLLTYYYLTALSFFSPRFDSSPYHSCSSLAFLTLSFPPPFHIPSDFPPPLSHQP